MFQTTNHDPDQRDAQSTAAPTPSSMGQAAQENGDQHALLRALLVHGIAGATHGMKTAQD